MISKYLTYKYLCPLLISGVLLGHAIPTSAQSTPVPAENEVPQVDFVFTEAPEDQVLGSDTAPLTAIIYASVTCGHCGQWFSEEWPSFKQELVDSGKLRVVLRALPTPPAQLSLTGFLIAECAPEDKYFDVIQYQMENQAKIFEDAQAGKAREAYTKVAAIAKLNTEEEINACLSNPDNMAALRLDGDRANAAEVAGVPAFFISGQAYKGPQGAQDFIELIDEMVAKGTTELPETDSSTNQNHADHAH